MTGDGTEMMIGKLIPRLFSGLCFGFLAVGAGPDLSADNWPQFRGPRGAGIAEGKKLPVTFGPSENLLWRSATPPGQSSPCVWGDRVFLNGFHQARKELWTLGIDRRDGLVLWRRVKKVAKFDKVHSTGSPATATPASDGERVYVYFASFGLVCYNFDGEELWARPLLVPPNRFGSGTSPIVMANRVILKVDQDGGSYLLVVDRRSGETVWRKDRPFVYRGYSTPVAHRERDVDEVITFSNGGLIAYDLKDGSRRWWVSRMPFQTCGTPVISSGVLFLNGTGSSGEGANFVAPPDFATALEKYDENGDGNIARLELPRSLIVVDRGASDGAGNTRLRDNWFFQPQDTDGDGALNRSEWRRLESYVKRSLSSTRSFVMAVRLGGQGDVSNSHVLWSEPKAVPEVPSPLYYRKRVYLIKNGGIIYCRDASTGSVVYKGRVGARGGYYASPVAGDEKIYLASDLGVVTVLKAGDTLDVLANNELGERIMATPAIVDGEILVRTRSTLFAFAAPPKGPGPFVSGHDPDAKVEYGAVVDALIAAPEELIPEAATWRFFRGRDEPARSWSRQVFDDSSWESGPSGFGYGDGDDATKLSDMKGNYTSLYIRRHFELGEADRFDELVLEVRADDGFLAYLNGHEIARVNAPVGMKIVPASATAAGNAREPLDPVRVTIDSRLLKSGKNTLALQGLNVSLSSSDFSLIPSLQSFRQANFEKDFARLSKSLAASEPLRGALILYLEGRLCHRSGKHEQAAEAFRRLIAKDRRNPIPHRHLAESLYALGKPPEALQSVQRALRLGGVSSAALWDLWFTLSAKDLERKPSELLAELRSFGGERGAARTLWLVLDELTRRNSDRVELVTFADPRVESAIKKRLSIGGRPVCRHELTRVHDLTIDVGAAIDLTDLAACNNLRWLDVSGASFLGPRLAPLGGLTTLREIHLDDTDTGDSDLAALKPLARLRQISLRQTDVTQPGAGELQRALPAVKIVR